MIWNISWPHVYWTGLVLRNENKKSKSFRLTATCWFFIDWPLVPWEQKSPVHPGLHRHSKLLLHVPWTQPGNKAQSRQSSPAYPAYFNNWIKYRSLATFIFKCMRSRPILQRHSPGTLQWPLRGSQPIKEGQWQLTFKSPSVNLLLEFVLWDNLTSFTNGNVAQISNPSFETF